MEYGKNLLGGKTQATKTATAQLMFERIVEVKESGCNAFIIDETFDFRQRE